MKAEAFRDDIASRAFAGITANPVANEFKGIAACGSGGTYEVLTPGQCIAAMDGSAFVGFDRSRADWMPGYESISLATVAAPIAQTAAEIIADLKAMVAEMGAPLYFGGDFGIEVASETPEDRAARKAPVATVSIAGWGAIGLQDGEHAHVNLGPVQASDCPGIAAMAAKNVQPTPEPVLSVGGQKTTEREIAQALALLRGKDAPAVKETPRGLMTVAAMDHRLGRWNEA